MAVLITSECSRFVFDGEWGRFLVSVLLLALTVHGGVLFRLY
ncbi:hypothetical protein HMPREF3214_01402 [Alloscardovia omnicolens]|nr:hypothetical protein HMPREF3214_01402 [Alloscardovia omnicolens]